MVGQTGVRDPERATGSPPGNPPASSTAWFVVRQAILVCGAIAAYFGVRGLTEGSIEAAHAHARWIYDLERTVGVAVETRVQDAAAWSGAIVTFGNWVYIWCHWPLVAGTLIWLLRSRRDDYLELRNAMFISGAIGLLIFATFPVAPPRLFGSQFIDTVTLRSNSYRVLQPPGFVNAYAAAPSLHFGWNLLLGRSWVRVGGRWWWIAAGVAMPVAMAWAVVVTANHWVFDVVTGGLVALAGVGVERSRRRLVRLRTAPTIVEGDATFDRGTHRPAGADTVRRSATARPDTTRLAGGAEALTTAEGERPARACEPR